MTYICSKCNKPVRYFHKYKLLWDREKDDFYAEHVDCDERKINTTKSKAENSQAGE